MSVAFPFAGLEFEPRESGALWCASARVLVVSDLHLGKSERIARRGGALLPPYETVQTLDRLSDEVERLGPEVIVSLGDSFDDLDAADGLHPEARRRLTVLMAGRRWIWIEGNHDPGPTAFGGEHLESWRLGDVTFRHIALGAAEGPEISGHYHPKASLTVRGRRLTSPCFVVDAPRLIMPAFGAYTGGLRVSAPALRGLLGPDACVRLTRAPHHAIPLALVA
ncbi:ligase-associated DNA damage response endonuclease PdeM [Roseobacter sp. HKCCA0434]|uniref:ligase-associated DNA damage response endonuclease PdeM n=1 Tax=Roseobacter sp. HKCCA0434 TaxID=3079297 RepID=UPI0029058571|nr:ligase-associated DNA damage response endonuclease PdeM [Roseobacter sp. HKCCA0434]